MTFNLYFLEYNEMFQRMYFICMIGLTYQTLWGYENEKESE